ncbi:hypothetical protein D3C87_1929750 [compost metagenome]
MAAIERESEGSNRFEKVLVGGSVRFRGFSEDLRSGGREYQRGDFLFQILAPAGFRAGELCPPQNRSIQLLRPGRCVRPVYRFGFQLGDQKLGFQGFA